LGPLFYYELVRLARRKRSTLVRCAYILVLFVTLYFAYSARFPEYNPWSDPFGASATATGEMAKLASNFVLAVLAIQTLAIGVLTPAYVAGAIAEERERGTLELLFMSHLSDREIVLGKLAARAAHLCGVLLAGLPLLALTQLWGGVDLWLLLAATLAAGLNVLAVAAVSIACSTHCRTALGSLILAYAIIGVASGFAGLFCFAVLEPTTGFGIFEMGLSSSESVSALLWQISLVFNLGVCILCNGMIAAVAILDAVFALRGYESRLERMRALELRSIETLLASVESGLAPSPSLDPRPLPPVGDWPLLWREVNRGRQYFRPRTERFLARHWPLLLILTTATGWLVSIVGRIGTPRGIDELVGALGLVILVIFAVGWCGDVAFRAAMSVCREREQKTLDDLLLLPESRGTILGAKWLGAILESRIGYVLMFLVAFLIGAGLIGPLQGLILVATLVAQLGFVASFGLRVSVASHTMLRAQVTTALMLLVFFAGGWIALSIDEPAQIAVARAEGFDGSRRAGGPELVRGLLYRNGLNPIGSWVFLAIPRLYFPDTPSQHKIFEARDMVTAWGALIFALAAVVLWLDAWRCLEGERQR
jgi:ABC-type transport system involved in multi-copper enzyme maturation permease subunit